jgi:hypothetical protein
MAVARTAPAVPGPQGQNPAPKPVPMTTGSKEGLLITPAKVPLFILNIANYGIKKYKIAKSFL